MVAKEAKQFAAPQFALETVGKPAGRDVPSMWVDLNTFLGADSNQKDPLVHFRESSIGKRFTQDIEPELSIELAERAAKIFAGVLSLDSWRRSNNEGGLLLADADLIQGWVLANISRDEFPRFVPPAFSSWEKTLTEQQILAPHIAQANTWIADVAASHFAGTKGEQPLEGVDLGAGTGSTMLALMSAFDSVGIPLNLKGVDLTPKLAKRANERTGKRVDVANALEWLQKRPDNSLDILSMVYAIHHLHYDGQKILKQQALRVVRPGGVFAIADPTGRSDYNLSKLDINEPEAVIACFEPSLIEVALGLEALGFVVPFSDQVSIVATGETKSIQQGFTLDQGLLGYAVVGVKPLQ